MSDVIGLVGLITGGTQDAVTMIDIPQDGFLIGIDWDVNMDADADPEVASFELSFISTNQLTQSDVRGRITSVSFRTTVLTAVGGHIVGLQKWLSGFDIPISAGERLFLHAVTTASMAGVAIVNLFFDFGANALTRRSTRRR